MNDEPTDRTETVETVRRDDVAYDRQQTRAVSKIAQIVWFIVWVIVTLLLVRVVLALLGANLDNAFANFIYTLSDPFVWPFRGLLQVGEFQAGVSRFEIETLVAALVYYLAGLAIVKAIRLAK